jgi:hypothetical protein
MPGRHGYNTLARSRVRQRFRPWQLCGLAGVLILAAVSVRAVEHAPQSFLESGTIVVTAPHVPLTGEPYATVSGSLVTTGAVMAQSLMSPQAQTLVRAAGGTADFSLTLVNFNNQDYPEFSYPLATLTAQSAHPGATRRTFRAALQVLRRLLAQRQGSAAARGRISVELVSDTGAFTQAGSPKRSLAALGMLTLIAMIMISRFLARHEHQIAGLLRRRHRVSRGKS